MSQTNAPTENLYNTNGLPHFEPPATMTEARERIAQLTAAVSSIEDQIRYRELSGSLEAEWFRRATTSKRFKTLEIFRLNAWVDEQHDAPPADLNHWIVAVVRSDYTNEDWDEVLGEARSLMEAGGQHG